MTDKKDCMTMEQAEQKMECLREVFSIVRLVDGEMLEKRAEHSPDADAMEMQWRCVSAIHSGIRQSRVRIAYL